MTTMNPATEATVRHTAEASNAGCIHFGEVVAALAGVGVESYAVDYRGRRITYYLPDSTTLTLEQPAPDTPIADAFDAEAVRAAIRGAQRGEVMYPAFKRLTQTAGCVGYTVWISGRHVVYLGRCGETHVEHFPD